MLHDVNFRVTTIAQTWSGKSRSRVSLHGTIQHMTVCISVCCSFKSHSNDDSDILQSALIESLA